MYQLFCARHTYAMGAHVLLEELGVDYEIREVNLDLDQQPNHFIAASPHGRVPALQHAHGTVCESGAICLYLADTHAVRGFNIPFDHPQRGAYLQWLFYLSSTIQPEVLIQFHPEHYFDDNPSQSTLKKASMQRLMHAWGILNQAYGNDESTPWLFAQGPTAVDISLAIQIQWPECFAESLEPFPHLASLLLAMQKRPAFEKVMGWHCSN